MVRLFQNSFLLFVSAAVAAYVDVRKRKHDVRLCASSMGLHCGSVVSKVRKRKHDVRLFVSSLVCRCGSVVSK